MLSVRHKNLTVKSGRIGVISDTHGLMRAEALAALKDSEVILHAGDIGKPAVLESLGAIAPVLAIRGNNDRESWARNLPDILSARINGIAICIIHNVHEMKEQHGGDSRVVVSGHSHKPSKFIRDGVLFLNPGSAGPRRFKLPVGVARLSLDRNSARAEIVELKI